MASESTPEVRMSVQEFVDREIAHLKELHKAEAASVAEALRLASRDVERTREIVTQSATVQAQAAGSQKVYAAMLAIVIALVGLAVKFWK